MSATEALENFRSQYPNTTSADLQAFVLGYNAAFKGKEYVQAKATNINLLINIIKTGVTPEEHTNITNLITNKIKEILDIVK
jgi:hypothetical protein